MSYAMKVARAQTLGDPGLFGFIGKAIGTVARVAGSVLPGPIGTVARVIGGQLVQAKPIKQASLQGGSLPGIGYGGPARGPAIPIGAAKPFQGVVPPSILTLPGTVDQFATPRPGVGCDQPGFHRNRTGYYTKRYGWVEKGSVCVKNRRRNPLNPRALSRSLARLTSAKKAVRCLGDFTVRPKKSCGCR